MMIADPRLVIFRFYYPSKTETMTLEDFDFIGLDDGINRITIDIEDIKQINIIDYEKILVSINRPYKANVDGEILNCAKSITIHQLKNTIISKKTIILEEISEYNIADEINEEIGSENVDLSLWKSK